MPRYTYTAIDAATGREHTGDLERADAETAVVDLKARGLFPTTLAPARDSADVRFETMPLKFVRSPRGGRSWRWRQTIGTKELTVFTRQLSALVTAGMPLVRSLDLLARQERHPAWQAVILSLADAIRSGGTLSDGFLRHSKIFDRLCVGMIKAGEAGGRLDVVLERLAHHLEKTGRIKARVQSAMTYPVVIMVVAAGIVGGLMAFVVPKFEKIFTGMLKGAPLPALTQGVLGASRLLQEHWLYVLGAAVLWRSHRFSGTKD